MKKLIISVLFVCFLVPVGVGAEYLITHGHKFEPGEWQGIDPGINPGWIGYQTEYRFFTTLEEALLYLNNEQVRGVHLYELKEIPVKKEAVKVEEKVIEIFRDKWSVEEIKPSYKDSQIKKFSSDSGITIP